MTARHRAWLLPLAFIAGYLVAWGSIVVDRQMVISEQQELVRTVEQMKKIAVIQELIDDFGYEWDKVVHWNKKTKVYERKLVPPKEVGK